ncbi:MAG: hypothetical protein AAF152_08010 [Cyanobacteria bacterium P01_A01_bin.114]
MTEEVEGFRESLVSRLSNETLEVRIISFLARLSQATYVGAVEAVCKEEVEWLCSHYPASTLAHWLAKYETAIRNYFQQNPMPGALTYTRKTPMGSAEEHIALLVLQARAARVSAEANRVTFQPPPRSQSNGRPRNAAEPGRERLSVSVEKQLFAELNDIARWGEGSPSQRLTRLIDKAKMADKAQAELELTQEKLALAQEKLTLAQERLTLEQEKVAALTARIKRLKA